MHSDMFTYGFGVFMKLESPIQRACSASLTSEKAWPWSFGACIFHALSMCVAFCLVCPISVPAALRRPQKKHAPGFLDHVPYVFCEFLYVFEQILMFGVLYPSITPFYGVINTFVE